MAEVLTHWKKLTIPESLAEKDEDGNYVCEGCLHNSVEVA